ncbi:MAG TPA: site-specific DNA-methyltransferase [Armatimonadota bacterium]|jgi:DNA modification methylase
MSVFHSVQTLGAASAPSPLFPSGHNRLILGDCLDVMRALPAESFATLYLDPPFFSNKEYHLHNGERGSVHSFTDNWAGGLQEYLDWLEARLMEMHRLLQPDGALFVHLDWHAVHYVKVLLDRLFGYEHFQNEFIWYYSGGGASTQRFARKHDNILYYTKSATQWKFYADRVRVPYKWTEGQKRADGSARDYARGKLPDDVWQHHALMPWAQESLGYPTQKPESLLERLLLATTDEGDAIGDFFCGAGTTAAVAQQHGRRWVTSDISRVAVCLAATRLAEHVAPSSQPKPTARARALAKTRFDEIMADEHRLGLAAQRLAECQVAQLDLQGFAVERFEED